MRFVQTILQLGLPLILSFFSYRCWAGDEAASFKACIERERNAIYNNSKLCGSTNSIDLTGGTEGEAISKPVSCSVKDHALAQVAEKCRKESFIEQSAVATTTSAALKKSGGQATSTEFIDGGSSLTAQPYKPKQIASPATSRSLGSRLAKASNDDEEDDPALAPAVKPKTVTKPAVAKDTSTDDDEETKGNAASTNKAKSVPTEDATTPSSDKQSATKSQKTNDATSSDNQNQSARTPSSSRSSGANVDADLASCRQAQSKAQQCCGSPASCLTGQDRANYYQLVNGGGSEDDGLTDTCERLNKASALSGDLNGKVAALCTNNQYACQNTCAALVTKYQNLSDSCGDDCDDYSTYQDAIASLRSQQTTCASLSAKSDALSIQSLSSGSDQGMAAACQQRAGADSSMGTASTPSNSRGGASASAGFSGAPTGASANATNYTAGSAPTARLSTGGSTDLAQLSAGYGGDSGRGGTYYGQALPGAAGGPAGVRPVPNGGGAFGAGAGGAGARAPAGPQRPSPGNSLISTDIEHGFRSGGYSNPAGGDPADVGARPASGGRGLASTGGADASGYEGMDLKQYLPGGVYYQRAGGVAGQRSEINGKEEDLFRRVSAKFVEKCKLGVLWRCQD